MIYNDNDNGSKAGQSSKIRPLLRIINGFNRCTFALNDN